MPPTDEASPQAGQPAPDLNLPDHAGRSRQLSEYWRQRPTVLLFVRHFG